MDFLNNMINSFGLLPTIIMIGVVVLLFYSIIKGGKGGSGKGGTSGGSSSSGSAGSPPPAPPAG